MTLGECLEAIGTNTKTYRLCVGGLFEEAVTYIETHDLHRDASFLGSPGRARAYAQLKYLLETEHINGH